VLQAVLADRASARNAVKANLEIMRTVLPAGVFAGFTPYV